MFFFSRCFIVLILLLYASVLKAQNWEPITPTEKFNYQIEEGAIITNTVWVDSMKLVNGDSVFYLDRIVIDCDTCEPYWKICLQPDFLRKEMVKKAGGIFLFSNPGTMILNTLAQTGENWIFDTAASLTAQVMQKTYEPVFGVNDSVKLIQLSNGKEIRLSKNFGLIQFYSTQTDTAYFLDGIEGRDVGNHVPRFEDFYRFNIGDVFQYHSKYMSYSVPNGGGTESLIKHMIISVDSAPGYFQYNTICCSATWQVSVNNIPYDTTHFYGSATLTFNDSNSTYENYYPKQIVESLLEPGDHFTSFILVTPDSLGIYSKNQGNTAENAWDPSVFIHGTYATPPYLFEVLVPFPPETRSIECFKIGLGETYFSQDFFEVSELNELIGYIKNGDTVGKIYTDDFLLLDVKDHLASNGILVYPNPAVNELNFYGSEGLSGSQVQVYDLSGKMILQVPFQKKINISKLNPGFFLLKISNSSGLVLFQSRFIKI